MEPTRSGNQRLTMTGISTLLTAMPASARPLVRRNAAVLPTKGLTSRPVAMAAIPAHTTAPGPKRRARRGAVTPKTAKHRAGREVSSPATLPLMPSPSRTSSSRAPKLVMAGRRFRAASTMPATSSRFRHARVRAPDCSGSTVVAEVRAVADAVVGSRRQSYESWHPS
ncbi:hypothetical protein SALBM217S_08916 [Streptomyces griseoloalbus]